MKINIYITALAIVSMVASSCTQDADTPSADDNRVRVDASIGGALTKVTYNDSGLTFFEADDVIAVQNLARETENISSFTYDGKAWNAAEKLFWNPVSVGKNKFRAWHPGNTDGCTFDSFVLPSDQSNKAKLSAADWMTAETDMIDKPADSRLSLNFKHNLVRIVVNWTVTDQYDLDYIDGMEFLVKEMEGVTLESPTVIAYNDGDAKRATGIVTPGTYKAGEPFIYVYYGTVHRHDAILSEDLVIEAGKTYTFNVVVGDEISFSVDGYTIPWEDGEGATGSLQQ